MLNKELILSGKYIRVETKEQLEELITWCNSEGMKSIVSAGWKYNKENTLVVCRQGSISGTKCLGLYYANPNATDYIEYKEVV